MLALESKITPAVASTALLTFLTLDAALFINGLTSQDWRHFIIAAEAMRNGESIYDSGVQGYVYPPVLAYMLQPLAPLGRGLAGAFWVLLSGLAIGGSIVFLARFSLSAFGLRPTGPALAWTILIATAAMAHPIAATLRQGQTDALIMASLVVALTQWGRRPGLVGSALAFAFVIKYQTLIFLPYLVWRRQWRATGWFLGVLLFLAALPALTTGWGENLENWQHALGIVGDVASGAVTAGPLHAFPIDWNHSVSLTSVLSRAVADVPNRNTVTIALVALTAFGLLLTAQWIYGRAGTGLLWRHAIEGNSRQHREALLMDWAGLVTVMLIFSIQSIARHFVVNALTVTIAAALFVYLADKPHKWIAAAGIALFSLGIDFQPFAAGSTLAVWLGEGGTSFGALALLFAILWSWSSGRRSMGAQDWAGGRTWATPAERDAETALALEHR